MKTCAWIKGNRKYNGKWGKRHDCAFDLVLNKKVRLSKRDCERLDLRKYTKKEIMKMCPEEATCILEIKGWKWIVN